MQLGRGITGEFSQRSLSRAVEVGAQEAQTPNAVLVTSAPSWCEQLVSDAAAQRVR